MLSANELFTIALTGNFSWNNTPPSSTLNFTPCYGDYLCARLHVPLNWAAATTPVSRSAPSSEIPLLRHENEDEKATLAIVKLPARVDVTDERYGGSIIINPGGPGGSGVREVLERGKDIQKIVDSTSPPEKEDEKYFDIVSFDPRGVGNSLPPLGCFPDLLSDFLWSESLQTEGLVDSSDVAFGNIWSRMQALGLACTDANSEAGIGRYMNTWSVAHDLHEISRQLRQPHNSEDDDDDDAALQYWGFSYGTLLGVTYATIFPDQVKRMVLDGVVDAPSWYAGEFSSALRDTDRVVDSFFRYCSFAGNPKCAFALKNPREGEDGSERLRQRLNSLLARLKENPLSVGTSRLSPGIVTYADVKRLLRVALYAPLELFPILATILADLDQGNATSMVEWKAMAREETYHCLTPECQDQASCREMCRLIGDFRLDTCTAVACLDLNHRMFRLSREEYWEQYLQPVMQRSLWVGDTFADFGMPCANWDLTAPVPFEGPTGAQNMTAPILFIGNTLDPVTPLADARAMSRLFNGSAVLEQVSEGHCSYSSRSVCTDSHIRAYFHGGALPEPGSRCESDVQPFLGAKDVQDIHRPDLESTEL